METMQFTKEQAVGLFTLLPRTRFECAYLDNLISVSRKGELVTQEHYPITPDYYHKAPFAPMTTRDRQTAVETLLAISDDCLISKLISANGCLTLWVYAINRKTKLGANLLIRF